MGNTIGSDEATRSGAGIGGKNVVGDCKGVCSVGKLGVIEAHDEETGCCVFSLPWVVGYLAKVDE